MRYLIGVLCLTTAIACDGAYFNSYHLRIFLDGVKTMVDYTIG